MQGLEARASRLGHCFGQDPSILLKIGADLKPLQDSVQRYLSACEKVSRKGLLSLPNRSLNGDVYPGREVLGEFKEFEIYLRGLISSIYRGGLSRAQRIPSIRVKCGAGKDKPYETTKIHSDIWAGEPSGCVLMIPISGDFESGGVEFFRPTSGKPRHFAEYRRDYSDAPNFKPEYMAKMEPGFVYIADSFCLHRTMIGKTRVSVDLRLVYEKKLDTDTDGIGRRHANYVPLNDWPFYETEKPLGAR